MVPRLESSFHTIPNPKLMSIRALIVDDEVLARKRILSLLEPYENIQVIGQCRNGSEAIQWINLKEPDLVFLDIQMPDKTGFQVLEEIKLSRFPYIIFTTAFDEFAIKAFDVNALDYLLKPFDETRFGEALNRAFQQKEWQNTVKIQEKMLSILKEHEHQKSHYWQIIEWKDKGKTQKVYADDILCCESDGNYVVLQTLRGKFLYRSTMNFLGDNLDPRHFLRIHRSTIINYLYVKRHKYLQNNEFLFFMKDGTELKSSKSFKDSIISFLEKAP